MFKNTASTFPVRPIVAMFCIAAASSVVAADKTWSVQGSQLTLPPATGKIYWAVNKDGSVSMSDRPESGVRQGSQTYRSSSDADSLAKAQREREYWHKQSEAFAVRQRERDRELDRRREVQAVSMAQYDHASYAPYYAIPPIYAGVRGYAPGYGHGGFRPFPQPANGPIGGLGDGRAAALGGGTSPFLSSGFARDLRR